MPYKDPAAKKAHHIKNREKELAQKVVWRATHQEEIREYNARPETRAKRCVSAAKYRATHPEEVKAQRQASHAANREERNARSQRYKETRYEELRETRLKNREKLRVSLQAWRQANPDKRAAQHARRWACKKAAPVNDFTAQQWRLLQEAYDHRCAYCGKQAKGKLTRDHISPLGPEGPHTLHNIVPACRSCNAKKGRKGPLKPVQPLLL